MSRTTQLARAQASQRTPARSDHGQFVQQELGLSWEFSALDETCVQTVFARNRRDFTCMQISIQIRNCCNRFITQQLPKSILIPILKRVGKLLKNMVFRERGL
jgi:hypothetical protein